MNCVYGVSLDGDGQLKYNLNIETHGQLKSILLTLARLQQVNDPYTVDHSHRVGLLAQAIAVELGWQNECAERMYYLGLVHDLGKMCVPLALLYKKEKLHAQELLEIRQHVAYGNHLLQDFPFDFPVAGIIAQHHERLDGTGYPKGLMADQIYLEAKILMVADVFEAMFNRRPYRDGLGEHAALAEIQRGQGQIYDVAVSAALIRLVLEKNYRCPTEDFLGLRSE